MDLKQVKRGKLTEALNEQKDNFKPNLFFITAFRATKDGTLQIEVCQNRILGGRVRTLLGSLNRHDSRFRGASTLLFNWMKAEPEDVFSVFPTLKEEKNAPTMEDLETICKTWKENGPTGKDALVYPAIYKIPHIYDAEFGAKATPVIAVTEVTHSQLINHEFYRGSNADEKIKTELEDGNAVMKTGAEQDDEYIVDSETGDRIYRFTRVVMKEDYPKEDWDTIIPNKVTESVYKKAGTSKRVFKDPSDIKIAEFEKQPDAL